MKFKPLKAALVLACALSLVSCKSEMQKQNDSTAASVEFSDGLTIGAVQFSKEQSKLLCFYQKASDDSEFVDVATPNYPVYQIRLMEALGNANQLAARLTNNLKVKAEPIANSIGHVSNLAVDLNAVSSVGAYARSKTITAPKESKRKRKGVFGALFNLAEEVRYSPVGQAFEAEAKKQAINYAQEKINEHVSPTVTKVFKSTVASLEVLKENKADYALIQQIIDSPEKLMIDSPDNVAFGSDRVSLTQEGFRTLLMSLITDESGAFVFKGGGTCTQGSSSQNQLPESSE